MIIANMLVDVTAKHDLLYFLDGSFSSIETFEWLVIPFELKNTRAIYQGAINVIFHDMLGHFMEMYIDDIFVKV